MKVIEWKVVIQNNKIASIEKATGFPKDNIESHLEIVGLLENLKQKHLDKMKTLLEKNIDVSNTDEELGC